MRALALEDSHDSHKELAKSEKRHSAREIQNLLNKLSI